MKYIKWIPLLLVICLLSACSSAEIPAHAVVSVPQYAIAHKVGGTVFAVNGTQLLQLNHTGSPVVLYELDLPDCYISSFCVEEPSYLVLSVTKPFDPPIDYTVYYNLKTGQLTTDYNRTNRSGPVQINSDLFYQENPETKTLSMGRYQQDGRQVTVLDSIYSFQVFDGRVYYQPDGKRDTIYSTDLDGKQKQCVLTAENLQTFEVDNYQIYYRTLIDGDYHYYVYDMRQQKTIETLDQLQIDYHNITFDDQFVYCSELGTNGFYRISKETFLADWISTDVPVENPRVIDGWLYFHHIISQEYTAVPELQLCRIKTDGAGYQVIAS